MPYPYRWMTACHVCSHKACLACNLSLDPNLYLNQGQQVPRLERTTWDANDVYYLTEACSARTETGSKSDLENQEILGKGQFGGYGCKNLETPSNTGGYENFLNFVEQPAPQVPLSFQQQFSEPIPISSTHSAPRETQNLNNSADFSNGETHVETVEEQIAQMPRNFESEVLETWNWIDRFYPLAMENGEEMTEFLADEPFFLPDETFEPDTTFSGQ
jgi:hypothetical protein